MTGNDITEKNLSDLAFCIGLLQRDFDAGAKALGMSVSCGQTLLALTPRQLKRLASVDVLLFGPKANLGGILKAGVNQVDPIPFPFFNLTSLENA